MDRRGLRGDALTISAQDVVFAFDMSRIETVLGVRYLWDYSPNGFHFAFLGGATDPTPQLDGSLSFDGGDHLDLPAGQLARFYATMPTRECTWFMKLTNWNGVGAYVFSSALLNGGLYYGLSLNLLSSTTMRCYQGKGTAGNDVVFYTPQPKLSSFVTAATVETTPRGLTNLANESTSGWIVGAFGTCAYNVAKTPTIGGDVLVSLVNARMNYLALVRGALSSPDLSLYERLISEGQKPWCNR